VDDFADNLPCSAQHLHELSPTQRPFPPLPSPSLPFPSLPFPPLPSPSLPSPSLPSPPLPSPGEKLRLYTLKFLVLRVLQWLQDSPTRADTLFADADDFADDLSGSAQQFQDDDWAEPDVKDLIPKSFNQRTRSFAAPKPEELVGDGSSLATTAEVGIPPHPSTPPHKTPSQPTLLPSLCVAVTSGHQSLIGFSDILSLVLLCFCMR